MVFSFKEKEKGFPRKSLYSCVVVLPLAKIYSHSYIEFFPTHDFLETKPHLTVNPKPK